MQQERILIVDDNEAIHTDFRKVLQGSASSGSVLESAKAALFGQSESAEASEPDYQVDAALSGREAAEKVRQARDQSQSYSVAFVDMRMPNGWDGLETIAELWRIDPELQIVLCTAYSDYSFEQIGERIGGNDGFLILKKPFDGVEVRQIAKSLSTKRRLKHQADLKMADLEQLVRDRTEEIQFLALHDRLTGLPNRMLLLERLQAAIERRRRNPDYKAAVLFLDFDRFKIINDSLGHTVGDELLVQVARRLQESVRRTDVVCSGTGTTSRLGGDEFVILLDDLREHSDAGRVADRLLSIMAEPYQLGEHTVHASASIGVTTNERDYDNPMDMIRDADTAMYRAKASGRGQYAIFDMKMHEDVIERLQLETELRLAIARNEFVLYYQPIMHTRDGLKGFEALSRWNHPQRGIVSPAEFLPVAEDMGIILQLDLWAIRQACKQLQAWKKQYPEIADISMSANLSRKHLRDPNVVGHIHRILQETGIAPQDLALEITESAVLDDEATAMAILHRIREEGIRLHLDDFGIGQSSLSCFHQFPLTGLKIDRSLVQDITSRPELTVVLKAIRQMTRAFHMDVIAEGIESTQQMDMLKSLDFDQVQGYLISRPMDAARAEAFIEHCLQGRLETANR